MNKLGTTLAVITTLKTESQVRQAGSAFLMFSGFLAFAGVFLMVRTAMFVHRAVRLPGEVVSVGMIRQSRSGSIYYPIFTITNSSGKALRIQSSSFSTDYAFKPGQHVTVLYDANESNHSMIDTLDQVWGYPVKLLGGAIFLCALGLVFKSLANREKALRQL